MNKSKSVNDCEGCEHCVALGEGDFSCVEGEEPVLVVTNWIPTDMWVYCVEL